MVVRLCVGVPVWCVFSWLAGLNALVFQMRSVCVRVCVCVSVSVVCLCLMPVSKLRGASVFCDLVSVVS